MIGKFWVSHHRFYGTLARFDNGLMWLNLLYLAWVALIPFTSDLLGNFGEEPLSVIVYAANMAAASLTFTVQIAYAHREGLVRPHASVSELRYAGPASFLVGGVFVLSMPVALLNTYVAQAMWLALFASGHRAIDWLARFRR